MTGFIRGLFGSKKNETDAGSSAEPQNGGAYYLSSDDSKTYGDIDYMRTAKTVRRTFPKGDARVNSVSSEQLAKAEDNGMSAGQSQSFRPSAPQANSTAPSVGSSSDRRKPDKGMDMFRNMAKDIRKK